MKFAQFNVNRSKAVHDLLWSDTSACDVLLLSEPNRALCKENGYICDKNIDAAVIVRNKCDGNAVINVYRSNGFVAVEFAMCVVISCYVSPNVDISRFEEVLSDMQEEVGSAKPTILPGGDCCFGLC